MIHKFLLILFLCITSSLVAQEEVNHYDEYSVETIDSSPVIDYQFQLLLGAYVQKVDFGECKLTVRKTSFFPGDAIETIRTYYWKGKYTPLQLDVIRDIVQSKGKRREELAKEMAPTLTGKETSMLMYTINGVPFYLEGVDFETNSVMFA